MRKYGYTLKLANFTREMLKEFFRSKSAYEQAMLKQCRKEGYEKDYQRLKLIAQHTWDNGSLRGSTLVYTCIHCGMTAINGSSGGPEYFSDNKGDLCLSNEEKLIKDVIE